LPRSGTFKRPANVNLKTAKAIDIKLPKSILLRADQLIE
jgi:hypothetical protein